MTELGLIIRSHPRDEAACLVSGAVKNPFRLLQSLRSRVDVVGVVCADQTDRFTSHGYEVSGRSLGFLKLYVRTLLWNLVNLPAVLRLFRRAEVVQCHHPHFGLGAALLRRCVFRDTLFVVKAHGTAVPELHANRYTGARAAVLRANSRLHRAHDRVVLRCADVCVTSSDFQHHEMTSLYGVRPDRLRTAYNGYSPRYLQTDLTTGRAAGAGPNLLFVGRVVPKKGLDHLLDIYEQVRHDVPGTRLTLVLGSRSHIEDPATFAMVEQRSRELGDCRLLFDLTEVQLFEEIAAADVGLVPSRGYESIPTVIFEMGAAGLPVFATWQWGIPEVLPARFALSGETAEDAARVVDFVRTELPGWGRDTAAKDFAGYSYDELVQTYLDIYESRTRTVHA